MENLYWYEYRLRGAGPGCQPKGFVEVDNKYGRYGKVAYKRKLSETELMSFDLNNLNKSKNEKGYEKIKHALLVDGNMDEINPENVLILLDYIEELKRNAG